MNTTELLIIDFIDSINNYDFHINIKCRSEHNQDTTKKHVERIIKNIEKRKEKIHKIAQARGIMKKGTKDGNKANATLYHQEQELKSKNDEDYITLFLYFTDYLKQSVKKYAPLTMKFANSHTSYYRVSCNLQNYEEWKEKQK